MVSSCEEQWSNPSLRPLVRRAGLWLRRSRAVRRGFVPAHPSFVRAALARAVLDVAEELLGERGLPFSARTPSFIFTGRAADQSGVARRTLQELFAEAKVRKVLHPQDGEAWVLRDAERALADAGWVWVERGVPKRNPRSGVVQPIHLVGGRLYGTALVPSFGAPDQELQARLWELASYEGVRYAQGSRELLEVYQGRQVLQVGHTSCPRPLWDLVAEGVLAPKTHPTSRFFAQHLLRLHGRHAARGTVLTPDWQARWLAANRGRELMMPASKPVLFVSEGERAAVRSSLAKWIPSDTDVESSLAG